MRYLLNPKVWIALAILAALALSHGMAYRKGTASGKASVQAKWDAEKVKQQAAVIAEQEASARETLRRLTRQKENQDAQDKELAVARRDAVANDRAAGELRAQLADTAKRWRDAFRDSPAGGNEQAAATAIGVLTDLLGRADRRAGVLATYADAARAAGLKCERDYEALTDQPPKGLP